MKKKIIIIIVVLLLCIVVTMLYHKTTNVANENTKKELNEYIENNINTNLIERNITNEITKNVIDDTLEENIIENNTSKIIEQQTEITYTKEENISQTNLTPTKKETKQVVPAPQNTPSVKVEEKKETTKFEALEESQEKTTITTKELPINFVGSYDIINGGYALYTDWMEAPQDWVEDWAKDWED